MWVISQSLLVAGWFAWLYPFVFRASRVRQRSPLPLSGPTRIGLFLEGLAIFMAFAAHRPAWESPGPVAQAVALLIGSASVVAAWRAVTHVRTGPYATVHPIYSSLLGMLLCTLLLLAELSWSVVSVLLFLGGTEIRVRTEHALLASRYGAEFPGDR